MSVKLEITNLRCNYLKNPLGIDSLPRFSWELYSTIQGQQQTAYRLLVASEKTNFDKEQYDIWDSGKILEPTNAHVVYEGKPLLPRTRYWWRVIVYDMDNKAHESEIRYFETGKLDERWVGNWITADYIKKEDSAYRAPLLRTSFDIDAAISKARLYICGLGYFEAYVNGVKPSDDVLSTAFTRYDMTVLYLTYDVTELVKSGKNALGVILGNGWYNCFAEDPWNTRQASWRHWPKVIAELHIELFDGRKKVIKTDPTWKSAKSPIIFNGIRNGEYYDARLEIPGWNLPEYDDADWKGTKVIRSPGGKLKAFELEPIRITQKIDAIRKWETPSGSWIFDMGQNLAGVARIKVRGEEGTEITIRYSDLLKKDNMSLDQSHIGNFIKSGEFQTDKYIKKSDDVEEWNPIFVYHGFQYVEISGIDYEPELDIVSALVMHTDFKRRGHFESSDETLNKIHNMCHWSTVSNFHGIPTDCPHREKNAWTGDAAISAEQTIINFESIPAYYKWMGDIKDSQRANGSIPCVVPSTGWGYNWGNGPDWSSALTVIPWYIYKYCGDTNILKEMYENIKRHCDFMNEMSDNYIVNYGIGDWCAPFDGPALGVNMGSFKAPTPLTDTAYFYDAAKTISKMAQILDKKEDAEKYRGLAEKIKRAFRDTFFDKENMKVAGDCQTSTACMLYQGLAEEDEREALLELLIKQIEEKDWHLDFGVLGSKYVMNILGEMDKTEIGLKMITQETYPSYKHWMDLGATTLWECWNGGGSHNHQMFSDVSAFMYKFVGGISPDENDPGFRHIILRPAIDCGLSFVKCEHDSMHGKVVCNWENEDGSVGIDISIPVGAYATLYIPNHYRDTIQEGGKDINSLSTIEVEDGKENFKIKLRSGKYHFRA